MKLAAALLGATLGTISLTPAPLVAETSIDPAVWRAAGVTAETSDSVRRLTLSDLAGKPVGLEQFRGRIVMLYFWATW